MKKIISYQLIITFLIITSCSAPKTHKSIAENDLQKNESVKNVSQNEDSSKPKVIKPDLDLIKEKLEKERQELVSFCKDTMSTLPGKSNNDDTQKSCEKIELLKTCKSSHGQFIYHYDKKSDNPAARKILTFSVVHGDEPASGSVSRSWMARLDQIEPKSHWRIVPILNPDGRDNNTRTNGVGVDINRNFPSNDWHALAHKYWKSKARSSKRRYPGKKPASEPETICAIDHINDFEPDLIIAIHTPLGVLDFDGPKIDFPKFDKLPWRRLGHFPGSMGRYMWKDKNVPVLTIELRGSDPIQSFKTLDRLQDISGLLAILADQNKEKE